MTHLGHVGARIDNVQHESSKSVSCVIQYVFPTNPHSILSISGRNLTYWLLEDDVSTREPPQIDTSAYSLPYFDTLKHISDDIFARNVNHSSIKLMSEVE